MSRWGLRCASVINSRSCSLHRALFTLKGKTHSVEYNIEQRVGSRKYEGMSSKKGEKGLLLESIVSPCTVMTVFFVILYLLKPDLTLGSDYFQRKTAICYSSV